MNLALFDLDNTLLAGDSDFEWAQFLISKGVIDREVQEARNQAFYEQYKAGTLDIHEFLAFQLTPLTRHPRAGGPRGLPSFRDGKITRVEDWLESLGLWWGSFADSFFYSDSHNDLPLMGKVRTPVAVDPDPTLRAHAASRGWQILSLR